MWSLLGTDNDPPVDSLRMIIDLEINRLMLCQYSSVARYQETMFGGSISCLVALMVLDFGRVINLT